MDLNTELLERFAGGQLEVSSSQPSAESYIFRGEIERAWVAPGGTDNKGTMHVRFKWLAKMGEDFEWYVAEESLDYEISIAISRFGEIGNGRLYYGVMYIWEQGTFFPPDGSKLDPADVKGLQLPA